MRSPTERAEQEEQRTQTTPSEIPAFKGWTKRKEPAEETEQGQREKEEGNPEGRLSRKSLHRENWSCRDLC